MAVKTKNRDIIISDLSCEDIIMLNTLSKKIKIRKECMYGISIQDFIDLGYTYDDAIKILYNTAPKLQKHTVCIKLRRGHFELLNFVSVCRVIFNSCRGPFSIEIKPTDLFCRIALESYDFGDGRNDILEKVLFAYCEENSRARQGVIN